MFRGLMEKNLDPVKMCFHKGTVEPRRMLLAVLVYLLNLICVQKMIQLAFNFLTEQIGPNSNNCRAALAVSLVAELN